jgi:hypothetical protein
VETDGDGEHISGCLSAGRLMLELSARIESEESRMWGERAVVRSFLLCRESRDLLRRATAGKQGREEPACPECQTHVLLGS